MPSHTGTASQSAPAQFRFERPTCRSTVEHANHQTTPSRRINYTPDPQKGDLLPIGGGGVVYAHVHIYRYIISLYLFLYEFVCILAPENLYAFHYELQPNSPVLMCLLLSPGRRGMPQVKNHSGDDDDTIGPNSRYMSVVNHSLAQQRRCQVRHISIVTLRETKNIVIMTSTRLFYWKGFHTFFFLSTSTSFVRPTTSTSSTSAFKDTHNFHLILFIYISQIIQDLEARMTKMHVHVLERNALTQQHRYKRMQRRLRDNLERNMAYQLVLGQRNIAKATDYKGALNGNYSYNALKPEVQRMIERMKPSYIREQKAKMQLQHSRELQESIIERNREHPSLLTEREREKQVRDKQRRGTVMYSSTGFHGPNKSNEVCVSSSGTFLMSRWAKSLAVAKTPTETPDKEQLSRPNEMSQGDKDQNTKLFTKLGPPLTRKTHTRSRAMFSPSLNKMKHPVSSSFETKSLKSLKSHSSRGLSPKAVSLGHNPRGRHVQLPSLDTSDHVTTPSEPGKEGKKRRRGYTLPPVKLRKPVARQHLM